MFLVYEIMYRLGFTPWEHREPPLPLAELIEGPDALVPGDMLEVGCGTGHDAIYCTRHGWNVTGVDVVGRALRVARRNARVAGATVRFLHADISADDNAGIGTGYTLLLDVGCLHGLADEPLERAVATISDAAKPGATFLMFAVGPGARRPAPRGIEPARIAALFSQWDLVYKRPASELTLRGPMRKAMPMWYQLTKR